MSAFDRQFDEFLEFMPDGLQVISRRAYTKEEAKNIYDKEFEADVPLEDIKEGWVRDGNPLPQTLEMRDMVIFVGLHVKQQIKVHNLLG